MPLFGSKPPTVRERIDDLLNDIAKASTSVGLSSSSAMMGS